MNNVYLTHQGGDPHHHEVSVNETNNTSAVSTTIDTTVPGPAEPESKPNYVLYGSIALVVVAVIVIVIQQVKKRKAPAASSTTPAAPEAETIKPTDAPKQ